MDATLRKAATEKGTILIVSMMLISVGATTMTSAVGGTVDWQQFIAGLVLLVVGVVLAYLREKLKFNRWEHMTTYWRGKQNGKTEEE